MQEYFSLLTATGANLLINAVANKTPVKLSKIAVGDSEIAPSEAATELENTKHEFAINSLTQDPQNSSILNVEGVIPSNVGGFNIRKFAIFTQSGEIFAVGRVPLSYKPALNQGAGSDLVFKIRILVGNVSNIELKVDNSVVLATRDWSEKTFLKQIDKIDAYTKTQTDEKFALKTELKDGIPTGSYLLYSSNANIPNGFLKCDGSALDKTTYAALFAVIGYTYGKSGDKFLLPNFSDGKFLRSVGGKAAALGTAQEGAILDHHHIHPSTNGLGIGNVGGDIRSFGSARSSTSNTSFEYMRVQGASTADENRPYNTAVVVLIKY
nr:MAG TPA: tail collar fiber protein [Caudoviricetes sp.]